ncbi:ADP-ribosylglycohydrolase family protein [Desulfofundulus thermosubterraneus]|uniref:ADP-ribosylglycohydrolase n=1 Tax=Desulfofundulus thermosubterraneus DSM 16057 TaxID=1121432 RepID=A0A1M6J8S9_9FIRM|nr:ADP-ribosylglycohydrolase family protein [Desulfofundulus thermosubterraneus]SHJ43032.1 ADP-ribosylglycohydrolase [Desulfofundulus thermosubterraneus DSM 16057]
MDPEVLQRKFCGCLLGLALGDALGAPFEGRELVSHSEIHAIAEKTKILRYTDDTHMALGVAESLIACRGFNGRHMAETFVRNFEQEPWRGYGPGPPRVFRRIKLGARWDRAAEDVYPGGSFGNCAAMRAAPVGLFYC